MKLHILSDLHLSVAPLEIPDSDADAVILAGDIARPWQAIPWAMALGKPVLYVAGNHEFYGSSIAETVAELKRLCRGTPVHVLDRDAVVLAGVRFLGTTLWTDFGLFGEDGQRATAMAEATRHLRDFSRIRSGAAPDAMFTPADSVALFHHQSQWLEAKLAVPHGGPTVVITHHAPSPRSIHTRFADSLLNAGFVSDMERLIDGRRACLWVHGHTHDSFDYVVNGTRIVCNPRGYARDGVNENRLFDPHFQIEIRDGWVTRVGERAPTRSARPIAGAA